MHYLVMLNRCVVSFFYLNHLKRRKDTEGEREILRKQTEFHPTQIVD